MGQFIAAIGPDANVARSLLSRLLPACEQLFGQSVSGRRENEHCAIASFARTAVEDESGQIASIEPNGGWYLGVGTWTCPGNDLHAWARTCQRTDIADRIRRLDGGFAVMISDAQGDKIDIATDHIGQLHVYRRPVGEATLISTSALALSLVADPGWNITSVREFLATGTVFGTRSLFSGIEKLEPATVLEFREGREYRLRHHWSAVDHIDAIPDTPTAIDEFGAAVESSMSALFSRYKAPIMDLTGGFDTRILLGCALRVAPTQTPSTAVVGTEDSPDVIAARRIADEFGLDHRRIDPAEKSANAWWEQAETTLALTDGEYSSLEYADILHVQQQLAGPFDVSINGSAGGFIRGNWWELLWPHIGEKGRFDARRLARARFATQTGSDKLLATRFPVALDEHFAAIIEQANRPFVHSRNTACIDNAYLILRLQRWQGRLASATNRCRPCASPMAFRRPLEIALGAPVDCRRNSRMARSLITSLDRQLASLPMEGGYPALPLSLSTLPQFTPLGREYASRVLGRIRRTFFPRARTAGHQEQRLGVLLELDTIRDEYLNPSFMLTRELYDAAALHNCLQRAYAGNAGMFGLIGRMLTLEQIARLRKVNRLP